jgi:helix-turn-helix protein
MAGLSQCIAEMIASKILNQEEGNIKIKVYGSVTSGNLWKFLKMEKNRVFVDLDDYGIKDVGKILGILSEMVEQKA